MQASFLPPSILILFALEIPIVIVTGYYWVVSYVDYLQKMGIQATPEIYDAFLPILVLSTITLLCYCGYFYFFMLLSAWPQSNRLLESTIQSIGKNPDLGYCYATLKQIAIISEMTTWMRSFNRYQKALLIGDIGIVLATIWFHMNGGTQSDWIVLAQIFMASLWGTIRVLYLCVSWEKKYIGNNFKTQ